MRFLNVPEVPLNGKVLIEASAGTGKTFTIGLIVIRLLLERRIPIEKIVLITFTKAATAELKKNTAERIREYALENKETLNLQQKAYLTDAISRIDEMPVFTIHGFCEKLLDEFAFETKNYEKYEVISNSNDIIKNAAASFWRREIKNSNYDIELNLNDLIKSVGVVLNHSQANIIGEDYYNITGENSADAKKIKYAIVHKLAKEIHEQLRIEKLKLKVIDFNDMIENCYKAIMNDNDNKLQNAIKKKYDAILVDEFQDTDKMQFEVFDYLFKDKTFFMIGDPKQAIYKFRGGDIIAYKAASETAGKNKFKMNVNYRSEKELLNSLNIFFNSNAFMNKMGLGIEYTEVKCGKENLKPLQDDKYKPFVILQGTEGENNNTFAPKVKLYVIAEIKRLLNTKKIEPKDIAILLDSNNDCLDYKNALAKEGINSVVKGFSVFISEAAFFIRVLLNAICYNNNVKYIRALLLHNFCGFEPKEIDNIFESWLSVIYEAKTKWKKHGVMNAIDFFMTKQKLWASLSNSVNGERHITNIRQIAELLNDEEIKFGKIPEKINKRFAELCVNAKENEESEEKLESDENLLKIMTIHKSKGLQFNIVFVPDISRSVQAHKFPNAYVYHEDDKEVIAYFSENKNAKELSSKEENEENARLLYVALTRAIRRLYVAYNPCYKRSKSYLRDIFDEFCKTNLNTEIQILTLDKFKENNEHILNKKNKENKNTAKALPDSFKITSAWQKASFSKMALYFKNKYDAFDLQKTDKLIEQQKEQQKEQQEITFPTGKRMGMLLHSIFESLDFNASEKEIQNIVENKLGGFKEFTEEDNDGSKRKEWIERQIKTTLHKNLGNAGKLCEVENKATELNFLMSSQNIDLNKIKSIMGGKIYDFEIETLFAKYINGSIDLVFLGKDNKYYILDWKSNNLEDFSLTGMQNAMLEHGYHLQYHIYAIALKRWLEKTHKDFNFKQQFGGIYYIFIRGINEQSSDGVYFAKENGIINSIEELDEVFSN